MLVIDFSTMGKVAGARISVQAPVELLRRCRHGQPIVKLSGSMCARAPATKPGSDQEKQPAMKEKSIVLVVTRPPSDDVAGMAD